MKVALYVNPNSSLNTPYSRDMRCDLSETNGYCIVLPDGDTSANTLCENILSVLIANILLPNWSNI